MFCLFSFEPVQSRKKPLAREIPGNVHLALLTRPREAPPPGSLLVEHGVRVHPRFQVPLPDLQPRVLLQQRHLVPQDEYRHHEAHLVLRCMMGTRYQKKNGRERWTSERARERERNQYTKMFTEKEQQYKVKKWQARGVKSGVRSHPTVSGLNFVGKNVSG